MRFSFLFFFSLLICTCLSAQEKREIPDEFNYFRIRETKMREISREEKRDTAKDNEFEKFLRWDYFWRDRIDRLGDMRTYPEQLYKTATGSGSTSGAKCEDGCADCCFPSGWEYLGPKVQTQNLGKITALWIDPSDDQFILAGAEGGLWKTLDGGANWENLTDFCLPATGISYIAVQPDNTDIIYISTSAQGGYGYGIFKTADGGATWQNLFENIGPSVVKKPALKVLIHPVNYSNVYALVGHEVYKSINSGATWQVIFGSSDNPGELLLADLELRTSGLTDEVYISSYDGHDCWYNAVPSNPGECNSLSPGSYWWGCNAEARFTAKAWMFNSSQNSLAVSSVTDLTDPSSPILPNYNPATKLVSISITANSINIGCQTNIQCGSNQAKINIYKRTGTNPWTLAVFTPNYNQRLNYGFGFPFEVSPANDNIIYYGGVVMNKSVNGGTSFTDMWPYWAFVSNPAYAGSHPDTRFLTIYNSTNTGNDVLFFGTDGGVSKTTDGGVTTLNLNGNLELNQFFGISNNETLPNLIYGGTQDNGVFDNQTQYWRNYPYGDGYDAVTDQTDPLTAYVTVNGAILRTTNGGAGWSYWGCPQGNTCWNTPMHITGSNTFHIGTKSLWRRNGSAWQNITNISNGNDIRGMAFSANDNIGYLVYGEPNYNSSSPNSSFTGKVYKVTNLNNSTPQTNDITPGLEGVRWQGLTDAATDDAGNVVWVTFGNFWESNKKVYKYENNAWSEYGQGLPNIPCTEIEYYKGSNGLLFLGTDAGVYYRDNTMPEWKEFRCGLPRTIISDLEINYDLHRLRAATYSRGIWESPIPVIIPISCTGNAVFKARVSPSGSFSNVVNNQVTTVNSNMATVEIQVDNICQGGSCCSGGEKVIWRIYKDGQPYQNGSGGQILFSGIFRQNLLFFKKKFKYRVEIQTFCGAQPCGMTLLHFNG